MNAVLMYRNKDTKLLDNNFFLQFTINPRYRVYRHVVFIIFIIAGFSTDKLMFAEPATTYIKFFATGMLLFLFYINMYLLVPKFLLKNDYAGYSLWLFILVGIAYASFSGLNYILKPYRLALYQRDDFNIFKFILMFTLLITASAGVKLFQRWVVDSKRINELEQVNVQSELEQLKNQINPHFLFNMLNNANVLTLKDPEKASQLLMKLSDLLRYQLYDSSRNKVLLTADIHFLEDFLSLEKIRRDFFEFRVSKEGGISGVQVSPLLFITFVENAVKHNNDAEKNSFVHVHFDVSNNILHFQCVNSKPKFVLAKSGNGGLGLINVKRRLELLYPAKHTLVIEDKVDTYTVTLTIRL